MREENTVYAITGYPGSGKSTAREIFEDEGYTGFEVGDIVTAVADEIKENPSEATERYGLEERYDGAEDWSRGEIISSLPQSFITDMVRDETEEAVEKPGNGIAVSGIRSPETLEMLAEDFGRENLKIIYIDADATTRYRRKDLDWQSFHKRTLREAQTGLTKISRENLGGFDYDDRIENNSNHREALQEFDFKVREKAREGKKRRKKNEVR